MTPIDPAEIGRVLDARAVGVWSVRGDHLDQDRFWSGPDLPDDVARAFAVATLRVSMAMTGLAIVKVAVEARPLVSIAADLPPDSGSGYWLRRFGATRSFALPIVQRGRVLRVVSAAVADADRDEAEIFAAMREVIGLA